jgi:hypothetical protein
MRDTMSSTAAASVLPVGNPLTDDLLRAANARQWILSA